MNNNSKKNRWHYIWKFARTYKWSFFNTFFCILATSFISMFYPYIFGILVNEVLYNRNLSFFLIVILAYGIIYFSEQLLHFILAVAWPHQYTSFLMNVRKAIYKKIMTLKYNKLANTSIGDMIGHINWEAEAFVELIHRNLAYLLSCTIKLIAIVFLVAFIDIKLALFMIIMVPLSYGISFYLGKKVGNEQHFARYTYISYISWCFEMLVGIREITLLNAQDTVSAQCDSKGKEIIKSNYRIFKKEIISDRICAFLSLLTNIGIYILAGLSIYNGDISVGSFIAVVTYFGLANEMLIKINKFWGKIHGNDVIIDKIVELFEEESEEGNSPKPPIKITNGEIAFNNVNFSYDGENKIFDNFCMNLKSGEKIALVGKSGVGKSTCVNLLLGLLQPESGKVLIDGQDISQYSLKSLREQVGIVQQEIFVFEGTIRDNLKLANDKATDEQLYEALHKVMLDEKILSLPDKLDSVIGQNGVSMSGGEKQRLAIARLFLNNKKILIFDEATSSLDYEAEVAVNKAWERLGEDCTCIIIAHRLSTVLSAEKVGLMQDGKIIASGSHKEMYENSNEYRTLFEEQYLSQKKLCMEGEKRNEN